MRDAIAEEPIAEDTSEPFDDEPADEVVSDDESTEDRATSPASEKTDIATAFADIDGLSEKEKLALFS